VVFCCPKYMKTHVRVSLISKILRGYTLGPPLNRGGEGGEGREGKGREEKGGKGMELGGSVAPVPG
jgi:hypothetical protein